MIAAAGGRTGWKWNLPDLPAGVLARERSIAGKLTRVTEAYDDEWPDAHAAWLTIGPQHFKVGVFEDREEAGWMCLMLAKAMIAVIDGSAHGLLPDGPPVEALIDAKTFSLTPEQQAAISKGLRHGTGAARL
jgi:hypothetical protein